MPKPVVSAARRHLIVTTYCRRIFGISGVGRTLTSVHALCAHVQDTGIYSGLASLRNIVHNDVG